MAFTVVLGGGDAELGGEVLRYERWGGEATRVGKREGGVGGSEVVGVEILGLVAIVEHKVLEEGVCREWGLEEVWGKER